MSRTHENLTKARARLRTRVETHMATSARRVRDRRTVAQAALERRRDIARTELARRRRKRAPRRRWPWLLAAALMFLLVLDCRDPQTVASAETIATPPAKTAPPAPATSSFPKTPPPRLERAARPSYRATPPPQMSWLDAFHLQVSARAPRLSACFVGAAAPGTLRWTTSVAPGTGRVSAHALEPLLASAELTRAQRSCVLDALSEPPYALEASTSPTTPVRIGLVLEF